MGPRFPLPGGQSQSGGGCSTTEEEASVRDLRTKGPQEQRSLQSLLAALGPVRSPDLSSLLDPTSGMSAVWSGQRKGALGRQGKPLYQKLRTRGSVAGTEDGRQRRSELFPSDVAFGATDHPASGCRACGMSGASDGLRVIGMDEISYRKRHKYLTVGNRPSQRPGRLGGKGAQGQDAAAVFPQARTTKMPRSSKRSAWTCGSRT